MGVTDGTSVVEEERKVGAGSKVKYLFTCERPFARSGLVLKLIQASNQRMPSFCSQ